RSLLLLLVSAAVSQCATVKLYNKCATGLTLTTPGATPSTITLPAGTEGSIDFISNVRVFTPARTEARIITNPVESAGHGISVLYGLEVPLTIVADINFIPEPVTCLSSTCFSPYTSKMVSSFDSWYTITYCP
ncbi:hypothetical protein PENTCL1PPCAC_19663, partial [Pristionchus entomophagus]